MVEDFYTAQPAWMLEANCQGLPSAIFFPEREKEKGQAELYAEARLVCRRCDVQSDCLDYAKANKLNFGMWGGESPNERSDQPSRRNRGGQPSGRPRKVMTA